METLFTKLYKYITLNIYRSPNVTCPQVCDTWLTKPYKYHVFKVLNVFVFFLVYIVFQNVQCFPCCPGTIGFRGFPCFPLTPFPGSVAGARLAAFPEVRFMRCAVHGSSLNTMKCQPSYQRSQATSGGPGYNPCWKHELNLSTTGLSHRQTFRPTAPALAPAG